MKQKVHPTHARVTRIALWVIGVSIVIEFVLGIFLINKYGRYGLLEDVSSIFFIGFIFLFLVVFFLSARLCKCPECKKWLTKQGKYSERETRKFILHAL